MSSAKIFVAVLAAAPVLLLAFSSGPPVRRTGAPVDGGLDCTACHRSFAVNSDSRGGVTIDAASYTPGVKQTVKVTVQHPEAVRWGFQLTARLASDPSKQAGTFSPNDQVRVRCDTSPGKDAPCNGAVEFPEHSDAPRTAAGAGFTFTVDWTPPSTNAGSVIFYAAGNAANGDGTNSGDQIYTTSKTISAVSAVPASCSLTAKPAITAVVNAASFGTSASPNTLLTIFGQNFQPEGTKRAVQAAEIVDNAFPKELSCLAVEIDGKRVPVLYVQPDQINVQAPGSSGTGPVSVTIIVNPDRGNALTSDSASVTMQTFAPAFFTFGGKSVAAQFAGTANPVADPAVVAGARAAKPGEIISVYATGFGATDPALDSGKVATGIARITAPVTVSIAGTVLSAADVLYAGLSPGLIDGLYQFNIRIPDSVPDGNVPITIQVGGVSTQAGATLPVHR